MHEATTGQTITLGQEPTPVHQTAKMESLPPTNHASDTNEADTDGESQGESQQKNGEQSDKRTSPAEGTEENHKEKPTPQSGHQYETSLRTTYPESTLSYTNLDSNFLTYHLNYSFADTTTSVTAARYAAAAAAAERGITGAPPPLDFITRGVSAADIASVVQPRAAEAAVSASSAGSRLSELAASAAAPDLYSATTSRFMSPPNSPFPNGEGRDFYPALNAAAAAGAYSTTFPGGEQERITSFYSPYRSSTASTYPY